MMEECTGGTLFDRLVAKVGDGAGCARWVLVRCRCDVGHVRSALSCEQARA